MVTAFRDLVFNLVVERGADIQLLGDANREQGALGIGYGEVNGIVTWLPRGTSPLAPLTGTFSLMQSHQPDLTFETLADGDLIVDGQPGVYLGFRAVVSPARPAEGSSVLGACRIQYHIHPNVVWRKFCVGPSPFR